MLAKALASQVVGEWKAQFRTVRDSVLFKQGAWREELAETAKEHHKRADQVLLSAVKGGLAPPANRPKPTLQSVKAASEKIKKDLFDLFYDAYKWEKELNFPGLTDELEALYTDDSLSLTDRLKAFSDIQSRLNAHATKTEYLLKPTEFKEALAISLNPSQYKPKSPISASAIAAFRNHIEGQTDNTRTIKVIISKLETFSAYLTTEGKPLCFDTVAEYLDKISDNRQTRQGHLWAMRKFHVWACRYNQPYREKFAPLPSPFAEHTHPRVGKAGGESWIAYTREEAVQLHTAASVKNDNDLADLIQFACYTGCRLEEIGRISSNSTVFDTSNRPIAFNIEDSKTAAGIRTVPIHSKLAHLYSKRLESTEDGFLFPGKKDKSGKRLNAPQQRFTKLKREQSFTDRHVFHSFRGTVATLLEQASANPLVITSILGHRRGSITFDIYSAGASLEQKKEAVEKLHFDFTL